MSKVLRQSKSEEKRSAILDAALTLFVKKGYHGTSIQDISVASGITKGGLYHYLKTKEEILFLLHDRFICEGLSSMKSIEREILSPKDKLIKMLKRHLELIYEYIDEITIFYKEWTNLGPENYRNAKQKRTEYENILIKVIEEGKEKGIFNVEDSRIIIFYIIGASNFMYHWYDPKGEKPFEDLSRIFLNFVTNGILAGKKS